MYLFLMCEIENFKKVIDLWGYRQLASVLDLSWHATAKMRKGNHIPPTHYRAIVNDAIVRTESDQRFNKITLDLLHELLEKSLKQKRSKKQLQADRIEVSIGK